MKKKEKSMHKLNAPELENIVPKEEKFFNVNSLIASKTKALQSSSLGTGHEHKDENTPELCQQLTLSFNERQFADLIFKVGPKETPIFAHKVIVGNRSLYFRGILSKSNVHLLELSYPEFSFPIFENVVQYLYSGTIQLKLENVLEILRCSEKLNVRSLSVLCCDYIQNNLDQENVCQVIQAIAGYNIPRLNTHCFQFIDRQILDVVKGETFLDLSEDLLIAIISCDELILQPTQEISIFHAVHNWAKHNGHSNDSGFLAKFAERIVKHIRFPLMPKNDLTNIVEPTKFVSQELLMEAYKNHLVPQQSNAERFSPRLCNARKK